MPTAAMPAATTNESILRVDVGLKVVSRSNKQATVSPDGTEIPADALYIEGFASTPSVDRYREIVSADAFKNSGIENFLKNPVILFAHDDEQPIGTCVELEVTPDGLFVRCAIIDEDKKKKIKAGVLRAFSIGFLVKKVEYDPETDLVTITELDLAEVSVVSVPANQDALFSPKSYWRRGIKAYFQANPSPSIRSMSTPDTEEQVAETAPEPTESESEAAADAVAAEASTDNEETAASEAPAEDNAEAAVETKAADTDTEAAPEVAESEEQTEEAPAEEPVTLSAFAEIKKSLEPEAEETTEEAAPEAEIAPEAVAPSYVDMKAFEEFTSTAKRNEADLVEVLKEVVVKVKALEAIVAKQAEILDKTPARKAVVATPHEVPVEQSENEAPKASSFRRALLGLKNAD